MIAEKSSCAINWGRAIGTHLGRSHIPKFQHLRIQICRKFCHGLWGSGEERFVTRQQVLLGVLCQIAALNSFRIFPTMRVQVQISHKPTQIIPLEHHLQEEEVILRPDGPSSMGSPRAGPSPSAPPRTPRGRGTAGRESRRGCSPCPSCTAQGARSRARSPRAARTRTAAGPCTTSTAPVRVRLPSSAS